MPTPPKATRTKNASQGVLLVAVVLVALNLRAALSSLPTVITDIQATTGWSDATLGILTTIPVLCMGILALTVPALALHLGRKLLVVIAMSSLVIAMLLRAIEVAPALLFLSAFLAGLGIALSAGVIPSIVRDQLPHALGKATALWTSALMASAALGAALTVPIALWLGSWSLALAVWALPAIIALLFWLFAERNSPNHDRPPTVFSLRTLPWRSSLAWALTLNMTINSIVFYITIAWLAPSYVERGWSQEEAGWLFGIFTVAQVGAALLLGGLSARLKYRRSVFSIAIMCTAAALVTIGYAPTFQPWLILLIFGFSISGSFAMMLGLLSEYSTGPLSAARLTAMGFFITYSVAAMGPFFSGVLLDTFKSWTIVFSVVAVIALTQLFFVRRLRRNVAVD